jgi:hypothetical protein
MKKINSGKLRTIGCDERTRMLQLRLDTGSTLQYSGVGEDIWRRLSNSSGFSPRLLRVQCVHYPLCLTQISSSSIKRLFPNNLIDTTRPTHIKFVPLANPQHAHRTARTVRGSQRNPQNRMAGARIDSRTDGKHRQQYNLFSKGESLKCKSHRTFFTQAR